jgi:hypothetical protein
MILLLDINRETILIVASDKWLSSEWRVYLFPPKLGEKNYYYECDGGRTMVYYP